MTQALLTTLAHIILLQFIVPIVYCWLNLCFQLAVLQSRSAFWSRKDKDKEEDAKLLEQVDSGKRKPVPGQDRHARDRLDLLAIKS